MSETPAETGIPQEGSFWLLSESILIREVLAEVIDVSLLFTSGAAGFDSQPTLQTQTMPVSKILSNETGVSNFFIFELVKNGEFNVESS